MKRKIALITSEYVMFNILSMINGGIIDKSELDIIVFDSFSNSRQIMNECVKYFKNVYYFDTSHKKRKYTLSKILIYVMQIKRNAYSELYSGVYGSSAIVICMQLIIQRNKGLIIKYVEDGFSTYCISPKDYYVNLSLIKRKVLDLTVGKKSNILYPESIFLYNPPIALYEENLSRLPGYKKNDSRYKDFFVCSEKAVRLINEHKIVYFGNYISAGKNKEGLTEVELLKILDSKPYANEIVLKMHPRQRFSDKKYEMKNICILEDVSGIWEIIDSKLDNDNQILMANFSTSLYSSSFIFGKRRRIIYLFEILMDHANPNYNYAKQFCQKLQKNGYDIYAPDSVEELLHLIEVII